MSFQIAGMGLLALKEKNAGNMGEYLIPNQVFGEPSARNHQISRDVFSVPIFPAFFSFRAS